MEGQNRSCTVMQGESFASQGVDECLIDECRGRDVSRVQRCNPGLPKMLEDAAGRFRRLEKIWASRATWIEDRSLAVGGLYGSDARQDHLLQSLLPSRRKLARLNIEFPVTTEFEKGVHIAHANELGVLRVVPRRDGLGNFDEGMALGDQE